MLLETLQQTLIDILIALLSLGGAFLILYINKLSVKIKAETEKIQNEQQRALVGVAIERVNDLCKKTVSKIEQTTAGSLRELVKDGKIDRAELLSLGEVALDEVYAQLSNDALEVLEAEVTDVRSYILSTIESTLLELKNQ